MSNPILKMLMGNSQKSSLNAIGNIIKNSNNPMAMMDSMFGNNPNYQEMKKFIDQNGGNVEQAFYSACSQKGVDANEILEKAKNFKL